MSLSLILLHSGDRYDYYLHHIDEETEAPLPPKVPSQVVGNPKIQSELNPLLNP